jgi:hypothetical protein
MSSLSLRELADMFAEVEATDAMVREIKINPTLEIEPKLDAEVDSGRIWTAAFMTDDELEIQHLLLVDNYGDEHLKCRIHGKEGQLCKECTVREILES